MKDYLDEIDRIKKSMVAQGLLSHENFTFTACLPNEDMTQFLKEIQSLE
ncbi:MAG: hypothetical protein JXR40_00335 [Pontiellaceae bacterium]|nr:hypothetical protein [Pontiellaceae bacterium]